MAEARAESGREWLAALMAWIGNTSAKFEGSPFRPAQFLPAPAGPAAAKVNVREIKDVLLSMKPGRKKGH